MCKVAVGPEFMLPFLLKLPIATSTEPVFRYACIISVMPGIKQQCYFLCRRYNLNARGCSQVDVQRLEIMCAQPCSFLSCCVLCYQGEEAKVAPSTAALSQKQRAEASQALVGLSAWLLMRDEQRRQAAGAGLAIDEDLREMYRCVYCCVYV